MRPWLIAAMVVVGLWALVATFSRSPNGGGIAFNIGYMIGSGFFTCLIASLVVGFVLWLVAGRRLQPTHSGRHVGILLVTAVATTVVATVVLTGIGSQGNADRAQLSVLMQDTLRVQEDLKAQAAALTERSGLAELLEPSALARPGGIARANTAIDHLEQEMSRLDGEMALATEAFRTEARRALRTQADRTAFDEGVAARDAADQEMFEARRQNYAAHRRQLDILSRTPRRWQVEGGQIAFSDQQQLAEFNAASTEIERTVALEAQIDARARAMQQSAVRNLQ